MYNDKKNNKICFRVSDELRQNLEYISINSGRSLSNLIVAILNDYLSKKNVVDNFWLNTNKHE